jgi:MerR family transcriptional regulator, thiopeptide resistance regulator
MAMTVGELSRISGVTVRTLHHYDEIGLVVPSQRTNANYRLYSDEDVLRLQQVLVFRELGMPLDEIAGVLDEATHANRAELLRRHRAALVEKRGKLDAMLASVDHAIDVLEKGTQMMTSEDFKKMFDGFDPAEHEQEAEERWGNTDAYKESQRRVKTYGKAEWEQIGKEAHAINTRFLDLMRENAAPADPRVQAVVEDHRKHISRWFYECSKEIHKGLGAMYVGDPRFTKNIDKAGAGLAQFMSDAIAAS